MFGDLMYWIYTGISWILLRWHEFWDLVLPGGATFLGTNWDWILAIVFLVITVRIILFPIFVKQIRSQRAMQALQPKMKELQEKHKGDKDAFRQETMKLYQTEKVNPLMGCLPMFLQIPVFLGLFHVLKRLDPVQTKNIDIYGWEKTEWYDAARARLFDAPIPAHFASDANELVTLNGSAISVKIVAGVLVLIMMATTFLTSRQMILKTGWSQDPQQRMIQKLMLYGIPISLLLSGWYFPIGVIIYWVTQNIFSLGQQYWVLHKYPPPVTEGSIPMKSAKTAAAEPKSNILTRFFAVKPKAPKPASSGGARFVNPVQPAGKSGLFRRRPEVPPAELPAIDSRSLAPKPGAKPVHPKPGGTDNSRADNGNNGRAANAEASRAPTDGPTDDVPADSPTDAPASSNGSTAKPVPKPPPAKSGGAKSGARTGGGKSGGAKSSTTARKSSSPRKGPANKKGGPRR